LSSLLVDQNLPSAMTSYPDSLGEDNRPRGRGFFSVRCAWMTGKLSRNSTSDLWNWLRIHSINRVFALTLTIDKPDFPSPN
jgi:hypothetical protein